MRKWVYIIFFTCVGLTSCEKENTEELLESEDLLASQEYFRAKINGKDFEVTDPENMRGFVYPDPRSEIMTFDLIGWREEGDDYEELNFKICFYDGPGIYYTGVTTSVSWADYYKNWDTWFNDPLLEDPGQVVVEEQTENFISGTFQFNAYSYEIESFVYVEGEFKVLLEKSVYED
ncbi:DUF6252 family protein [Salinimicrobium soli]|uniref:DUF6252 family protein n=1 Tax=Salinimicrobium soli TaxID=1254399 RepID=UPI003AAD6446